MKPSDVRVAVDLVIFTVRDGALQVLLIERGIAPFKGQWALPGGFVLERETLEEAARRELEEETGLREVYLEQLFTFGDPERDPRGRIISVAYYALTPPAPLRASTDAANAAWHPAARPPKLAFDHAKILRSGLERLRAKLGYSTVGFELLPRQFTLTELQTLYEAILERPLDKRNFRKKILSLGLLKSEGRTRAAGAHRPARLYAFALGKVKILDGQIV
ncbi:MAG TPA: NUDIX domain-containing protein [Planctomycetota bacterium]|nr:NUDIX domain-containing protein [Planctomycetota bacterium]